jgi:hypothetical protein
MNDHNCIVKSRSLYDGRCVFRIRPRKKIAFAVRLLCIRENDIWDEIDQQPGVQLDVSMNCAYLKHHIFQELGNAKALRPCIA